MDSIMMLPLALIPSIIVFVVVWVLLRKRMESVHQWVQDTRSKVEVLETEMARLEEVLGLIKVPANLEKKLKVTLDRQNKKWSEGLAEMDRKVEALQQELASLQKHMTSAAKAPPPAPSPLEEQPETSGPNQKGLFNSPVMQEVLDELAKGTSSADIARMTGLQVGEIDLIRGLRHFAGKESVRS